MFIPMLPESDVLGTSEQTASGEPKEVIMRQESARIDSCV